MQKSKSLFFHWSINKFSPSHIRSFRRVHTIINFNSIQRLYFSILIFSFSFFPLYVCCCASRENGSNCRLWVTPIVLYSSSINEQVPSVAAPSLYSGIYLYTTGRAREGAEAITHRAFWWHSYEWLYSILYMQQGKGHTKKERERRTVGSLFQINSWVRRGRNPPRLWRGRRGRSPARIAKLLSPGPVKFEKRCTSRATFASSAYTSPVVANGRIRSAASNRIFGNGISGFEPSVSRERPLPLLSALIPSGWPAFG